MKKILLILGIASIFYVGFFLLPKSSVLKVKEYSKIYKSNLEVNELMEFLKNDKYAFIFEDAYLSSEKNPRFIGKPFNKDYEDRIMICGKEKAFRICYSMPINDEGILNNYSIENMKAILKLMDSSLDDSNNLEEWVEIANKSINNYDGKDKIIDDNIISFEKDSYSNAITLSIEKIGYYDINEYKN